MRVIDPATGGEITFINVSGNVEDVAVEPNGHEFRAIGGNVNAATNVINSSGATTTVATGSTLTSPSVINSATLSVQSGGTLDVGNLDNNVTLNLTGGRILASSLDHTGGGSFSFTGGELNVGTFSGTLAQDGGVVTIGSSPGLTNVTQDYDQNSGTLQIELAGATTAGTDYDLLNVTGTASLDATIDVNLIDGFFPSKGDSFQIVTAAAYSGVPTFDFSGADISSAGLRWETIGFLNSGTISVVPEPSAGMFMSLAGLWMALVCRGRRLPSL